MFKKIMVAIGLIVVMFCMIACNKEIADFTYKYDYAVLYLPNGNSIEGWVDSWLDFDNSDQIQVTIEGTTYLVHSSNVVLIDE